MSRCLFPYSSISEVILAHATIDAWHMAVVEGTPMFSFVFQYLLNQITRLVARGTDPENAPWYVVRAFKQFASRKYGHILDDFVAYVATHASSAVYQWVLDVIALLGL